MTLEDVIKNALDGHATLFAGSGFSYGSTSISGNAPLSPLELTAHLYSQCGVSETDNDLKNASEFFLDNKSPRDLIDILKQNYSLSEVSKSHLSIVNIPWKRIYTTNYDDCVEVSAKKLKKNISPVVLSDRIDQYHDKRKLCIHLNGYIDRLGIDALNDQFKLTNTSYLTTEFQKSGWVNLFRNDIQVSKSVIFIGFSLSGDLDLARVVSSVERKQNIAFIVKPNESLLQRTRLEKFGQVFDIGVDGFAEILEKVRLKYEPEKDSPLVLSSFNEIVLDSDPQKIHDIDAHDLFFKGNINRAHVFNSLTNPQQFRYFIKRDETTDCLDYLLKEGGSNLIVHSDLGNGKTLFLEGLSQELLKEGYRVFWFNKYFDTTFSEIESIATKTGKAVLIIENYSSHYDVLKELATLRTKELKIIVSERTIINDTALNRLENILFNDDYNQINLNYLSPKEVNAFIELFDVYGLWGPLLAKSTLIKYKIITDECRSSIRLVLLKLIDSNDIKQRFDLIFDFIKNANHSFFEAILFILVRNIFSFRLSLDDLIYIMNDELLNNPAFNNNEHLKEMINFKEYKIEVRSSILSESLLSQSKYHKDLIVLLTKVFIGLDSQSNDKNSNEILKNLVSFSKLQSVFNLDENSQFRASVFEFYENIKTTSFCKKNPFFWLQYAIARLSSRNYPMADTFFNAAYSFGRENPNFDSFHIDNHYARFILENEYFNGTADTAFERFMFAHKLLVSKQDTEQNRHYPLRVATHYGKIYDKYFSDFTNEEKILFLDSCKDIRRMVFEYKKNNTSKMLNRSVVECDKVINRILGS